MSRPILIVPEALSMGLAAAAVTSIPSAARVGEGSLGLLPAWFAIAGLLAGPFVASIAAARLARRWLGVVPPSAKLGLALWALSWAGISLPLEAVFGALLKTNTHHRALGGTTFAAVALAINLGALVGGYRLALLALPVVLRHPKLGRWGIGAAMAMGISLLTLATSGVVATDAPAEPSLAYYSGAVRLDAALAVVAATAGVLTDVSSRRRGQAIAWVSGGSLVALIAVGFAALVHWPGLAREVGDRAPLAGTLGQLFAPEPNSARAPNGSGGDAPVSAATPDLLGPR
jgi:hypothetical protein